ncbi:MAG TPA: OmpA family protein [Myxococcales bacterium]|jgi:peptidoglycan-associated lipoprotein
MVGRFGWGLWALFASTGLGCATNIMTVPAPQVVAAPAVAAAPAAQPVVLQLVFAPEDSQARAGAELMEAFAPMPGTSLFFETGQASLSPDGKVRLLRIGEVLHRYPTMKVRVEGNADERGPADYNMELGARRARAARDYLLSIEVKPDQILLRNNGAERPLAKGHDEDSWQVNRRDDVRLVHDADAKTSNAMDLTAPAAKPAAENTAEKK